MGLSSDVLTKLQDLLGQRLSVSAAVLDQHARDEAHTPATPPDAVAFPETTAEVAEIVRICAAAHVPVIPWGVGTSLEGHALALQGGVTLDMSRMAAVLEVADEDRYVRLVATADPSVWTGDVVVPSTSGLNVALLVRDFQDLSGQPLRKKHHINLVFKLKSSEYNQI